MQALINKGAVVVEPLLECLERDDRLTRSVQFWRDFHRSRTIITVYQAAYEALCAILETNEFERRSTGDSFTARGPEGRAAEAARLRAAWTRGKGLSTPERWYKDLADEAARPSRWVEVAVLITTPEGAEAPRNTAVGVITRPDGTTTTAKLRGEPLRGKRPTVSSLLADRARRVADGGVRSFEQLDAVRDAARIAEAFARWDPPASIETLRFVWARARSRSLKTDRESFGVLFARIAGELTVAAIRADDPDAGAEYARWMEHLPADAEAIGALAPLWECAERPDMKALAERLFLAPDAPWRREILQTRGTGDALETPLLARVPAAREAFIDALGDRAPVGTIRRVRSDMVEFSMRAGGRGGVGVDPNDPLLPPVGEERTLRRCDEIASDLRMGVIRGTLDGLPPFEWYWPEEKRDGAIAETIRVLRAMK